MSAIRFLTTEETEYTEGFRMISVYSVSSVVGVHARLGTISHENRDAEVASGADFRRRNPFDRLRTPPCSFLSVYTSYFQVGRTRQQRSSFARRTGQRSPNRTVDRFFFAFPSVNRRIGNQKITTDPQARLLLTTENTEYTEIIRILPCIQCFPWSRISAEMAHRISSCSLTLSLP